jgi:hypothetical protein
MTKLLMLGGLCMSVANAMGQNMAGFNTCNYTGVTGVFFNPSSIADSRYRFDINLFSLDASAGSNKVAFSFGSLGNTFKGDTLRNQLFGNTPGKQSEQ